MTRDAWVFLLMGGGLVGMRLFLGMRRVRRDSRLGLRTLSEWEFMISMVCFGEINVQ
jgi:hypothetical protein